jgi:hypothetical protein
MRRYLFRSALVIGALICTACSSSLQAEPPGADFSRLRALYVRKLSADGRGLERMISDRLSRMGFQSSFGDSETPPSPVDGIVTYQDEWTWDITMYMSQLNIQIRDGQNRKVLAGQAMHTSVVRRSPEEMVEEVLAEIFTVTKLEAMIASPTSPVHTSESEVVVSAIGGRETSAMATRQISNQNFAQAIRQSLEQSKLFVRKALNEELPKYRLRAETRLNQSMSGGAMTVSMDVNYTLIKEPKEVVWKKAISSTYASDASVDVIRLRLGTEGAARNNIQQAIEEISKLKL